MRLKVFITPRFDSDINYKIFIYFCASCTVLFVTFDIGSSMDIYRRLFILQPWWHMRHQQICLSNLVKVSESNINRNIFHLQGIISCLEPPVPCKNSQTNKRQWQITQQNFPDGNLWRQCNHHPLQKLYCSWFLFTTLRRRGRRKLVLWLSTNGNDRSNSFYFASFQPKQ